MFFNIRGLASHLAELVATLKLMSTTPAIVCLNETFLDSSTQELEVEGYECVARRDRADGRQGGGVAVYARKQFSNSVTS